MNFLAIIFIFFTFYYLKNLSHLQEGVAQKIVKYDNNRWIFLDLMYYFQIIIYWIWLLILLFTHFNHFGIALISIGVLNSLSYWFFQTKFDLVFIVVKLVVLFWLIIVPFF